MATLNLRDRLLETTIAYIGAAQAGVSTNLDQLHARQSQAKTSAIRTDDDVVSLDWRPLHFGAFDDCEISVRLLSPQRGRADGHLLNDVDGVVLVVDSHPEALAANRAAADELRVMLSGRDVPVVMQLNKRDLPDALTEEALVAALDASAWSAVGASATAGDGVMETIQRAVEGVIARMKGTDDDAGSGAPIAEANPLLAALRSVLDEAIRQELQRFERRLHDRIDTAAEQLAGLATQVTTLREDIAGLHDLVGRACTRDDLRTEGDRRATELDTAVQRQREQVVASVGAFQRTLDAALSEARNIDVQSRAASEARGGRLLRELGELARQLHTVAEAIAPIGAEVSKIVPAVDGIAPRLLKAIDARGESTVSAIDARAVEIVATQKRLAATGGDELSKRIDDRTEEISDQLQGLIEELRKPKRGWFG